MNWFYFNIFGSNFARTSIHVSFFNVLCTKILTKYKSLPKWLCLISHKSHKIFSPILVFSKGLGNKTKKIHVLLYRKCLKDKKNSNQENKIFLNVDKKLKTKIIATQNFMKEFVRTKSHLLLKDHFFWKWFLKILSILGLDKKNKLKK